MAARIAQVVFVADASLFLTGFGGLESKLFEFWFEVDFADRLGFFG